MDSFLDHIQSIIEAAQKRLWLISAGVLIAIGALLMIVGQSLGVRMFGAWMTLLVILAGALSLGLYLSMKLAGPNPTSAQPFSVTNSRASIVFFSLLVASMVSRSAVDTVGVFISSLMEALFVATPNIVMHIESNRPDEITAQKVGLVLSDIFRFIQARLAENKANTASWTRFFIAYGIMLFLGRALSQSHAALDEKPSGGTQGTKNRPILMSYPKWLALCLYCAILIPATYFSLGALLRLGIDTESQSVSISEALATAAKPDGAQPPPLNLIGIQEALKKLEPAERSIVMDLTVDAARDFRVGETKLEAWQAAYEAEAIDQVLHFAPTSTADQLADEVVRLTAPFRAEMNTRRAQMRGCLADLTDLQTVPATRNPSRGAVEIARSGQERCAAFADDQRPHVVRKEPIAGILNTLYGWMAQASESAVLIIGLVGFGLFGATIRMMGSPDQAPVTESELAVARSRAEAYGRAARAAISETKPARDAVDAAKLALDQNPPVSSSPDKTTAEQDALARAEGVLAARLAEEASAVQLAKEAEQTLRHLERAAIEDRNDFVIERRTLSPETGAPETEYVVSGAPAKVLVSGLGAAFTVFLAGKAGVQIFTNGGQTSPTGLLLACFVGAVFAQNIWEAVGRSIKRPPSSEAQSRTVWGSTT